jgi:prepilin peptidase CpaA
LAHLSTLLQTICLAALAGVLVAAAWQDLRTLHISNGLPIAVTGLFVGWAGIGLIAGLYTVRDFGLAVACGVGLFLLGAAAFAASILGGGDVKLLAAVGLFAGPAGIADLMLVTALTGGLLGLAVAGGAPLGPASTTGEAALRRRMPYGPAIAVGGLWVASTLAVG